MAKKTYDECYEIAKRYSTKKSFRENEQYVYGRALRNGWLKDYTWLGGAEKYSYEECRYIAEGYETKQDFKRLNPEVYSYCLYKRWTRKFNWSKKGRKEENNGKRFNYEFCYDIAKKYRTTREFNRAASAIYGKAKRSGWLKDYTWMDDNTSHHIKKEDITYEACMKRAKNYFSKTDMARGSKSYYLVAKENNWLKDYTWFVGNEKWGSDVFLIYAYEDHENRCVYVGLTKDLKRRRKQHKRKHPKTHEYDVVKKYFDLLGQDLPEEVILEEHLTPEMAQEREGFWLQKYLSEGWTGLNIAKTGSGASSVGNYAIKWSREKCLNEAKECKTLQVFMTQHNGAYQASVRNGWLADFDWLERKDRKKIAKK